MSENEENGTYHVTRQEWVDHVDTTIELKIALEDIALSLKTVIDHVAHLATLNSMATSLDEMRSYLMGAATGRAQIPLDVAKDLFAQANKDKSWVLKVLGITVLALIGIIVFLLTGEHFGWINKLPGY